MTEAVGRWLLGVAACTMLVSLAEQLCPEGSVRKILRFTGALLLLLAMLRPVGAPALSEGWSRTEYRAAVESLEEEMTAVSESALANGIAEELAAYIEDKAASMGCSVRAEVTVESTAGVPSLRSVTIYGAYDEALSEIIASELGLTKERQKWIESK